MNGKPTFQRIMREKQQKSARIAISKVTPTTPEQSGVVAVGSWVFEENEDGDLVIRHTETGATFVVSKDPEG